MTQGLIFDNGSDLFQLDEVQKVEGLDELDAVRLSVLLPDIHLDHLSGRKYPHVGLVEAELFHHPSRDLLLYKMNCSKIRENISTQIVSKSSYFCFKYLPQKSGKIFKKIRGIVYLGVDQHDLLLYVLE